MYIIKEYTTKLDLETNEQVQNEWYKRLYFTSIKQAQKYLLKYEISNKNKQYNLDKIKKDRKENMFFNEFDTIDNKYRYITTFEIIKFDKFGGFENE